MAVTIVKRPETDIEGNFTSRWLSIAHPINFELQGEAYDPDMKANYGIIVEVYEQGSQTLLGRTKRIRPYFSQPVRFNAMAFLENYIKEKITNLKRGETNIRDEGKAIEFYIRYKDIWDGAEDNPYVKDTQTYYAAYTKQQVGSRYGSNLAQFLPVPGSVEERNKAKFLTVFKEPVFFRGYPQSVSMIYPSSFNNVDLQVVEERENINRIPFAPIYRQVKKSQINGINRIQLSGSYPPDVRKVTVHVRTGQVADTDYYQAGYINSGFID